ncbi:hypothetical protein AB6F61_16480 [Providencia hangzhouensis]|uniref:hypothetical protein n=1 Tax=Providencia hangzhouensis TaxID=3031799 RepID=UPI0034DD97E7
MAPKTDFRALWSDDALYSVCPDDKDIQLGDNPDKDQAVLDSQPWNSFSRLALN